MLFVLFFLIMLHPMSAMLAIPLCVVVAAIPDVSQRKHVDGARKRHAASLNIDLINKMNLHDSNRGGISIPV